jgi:hypothetical protein
MVDWLNELFHDTVSTQGYGEPNNTRELWIVNHERWGKKSLWPILRLYSKLPWKGGKSTKKPVRIAGSQPGFKAGAFQM